MRKFLNFLTPLWPRAEVVRLRHDNEVLSTALRNATDKCADALIRLEEARTRPCPSCDILKQTVNFHVLAAGSKVGMFDGCGPTVPVSVPRQPPTEQQQPGPVRASKFARQSRHNFLSDFMRSEAQVPLTEEADPASSTG